MPAPNDAFADALLAEIARRGVARSTDLQRALGRSQPTLSRALRALGSQVVVLGAQRSARYAIAQPLRGLSGQQPLCWTDTLGRRTPWGTLTHLGNGRLHVQAGDIEVATAGGLPWFLAPLKLQGFLGRLWACSPAAAGLDTNPERWRVDELLAVLLQGGVHDLPGAISLGETRAPSAAPLPREPAARLAHLDALAADVARTLPAGSSAGGEQAKLLVADGDSHLLVKFTPPLGTPFGARWHDLLHAEAMALEVLAEHGVPVAAAQVWTSTDRSYLASERFDRVGASGRRHVVPLDAVHDAFVPGPRRHWAATCEALARQRRLPREAPAQALALLRFGHLIGNSDMHFGNLSVSVESPADAARGRFALAPVYDMLPMRWRPDATSGDLSLLPFTPDPSDLDSAACAVARAYWQRLADRVAVSRGFRRLAAAMCSRLRA